MADISEIHEKVLAFLLEWRAKRDPELRFSLNEDPISLAEGYWISGGSDLWLKLSFWKANSLKFPNFFITIVIDGNGTFGLYLNDRGNLEIRAFLKHVADTMGGFQESWESEGENPPILPKWSKMFHGENYLDHLRSFLAGEKLRIDQIINQYRTDHPEALGELLSPFDKLHFRRSLRAISKFRSKERKLELQSIKIENTGLFSQIELDFGRRATALIGENGCGKTTILRAAALGMLGTGSPLIRAEASELQNFPKISGIDEYAIPQYEGPGQVAVSYRYNDQIFESNQANVIRFKQQKHSGIVVFTDQIDPSGIGLPAGESDEDEELPYLILGYPQRYGTMSDGTNIYKRSKAPNAYDVIPLILKTADNRIDSLKVWMSESWNANGPHKKKVITLFKLISDVLSIPDQPRFEIELLHAISAQKIVVSTPVNPEGILYDMLSTGLENLFGWLGHLISRMYDAYKKSENPLHEPAVVFIDEIDNYLHPEIQVKLMKILLENFPKTQFIFTAHSPFILSSLPSKDAKAYRIENGKAIPIRHFYGQSIQNISYDQFGIKKRPVEIQSKIDEMMRAFAFEHLDKAKELFAELKPILGDDDPAILDAMLDIEASERHHAAN
jgi:hypothetical protein